MSFQNCKIIGRAINPDEYHLINDQYDRGTDQFIISPSSLREFGVCPARWKAGYEPPDSEAKDFGSLLDCLVLTPEDFDKRFAVIPSTYPDKKTGEQKPWHGGAGFCKQWKEDVKAEGRQPVKRSAIKDDDDEKKDSDEKPLTLEGATLARNRLFADPFLKSYIDASDKQVWVRGEWLDEPTGLIIPVQCLMDVVPRKDSKFSGSAGDLKSTRSAHHLVWPRYSLQRGYHIQAAFDLDMLNAAENGGNSPPEVAQGDFNPNAGRLTWLFLLSENFFPYQTGRAVLSQRKLEVGRLVYQGLLEKYARCVASGKWPDYEDHPNVSIDGCSIDDIADWEAENQLARLEGKPEEPPGAEPEEESEIVP